MELHNLSPAEGSTKDEKRVGRGNGSGHGTTAGRGTKGQKSRSGTRIPFFFEGGQMPLVRRLPKFGFHNPERVTYQPINVGRLATLVEEGRLDAGDPVTVERLVELGVADENDPVKILGDGSIEQALDVHAHAFSTSAREKIEEAGGSVSVEDDDESAS